MSRCWISFRCHVDETGQGQILWKTVTVRSEATFLSFAGGTVQNQENAISGRDSKQQLVTRD